MTDRPILFSGPMIRALLAGKKTQTRRKIKSRGSKFISLFNGQWSDSYVLDPGNESWRQRDIPIKLGDRLWVRENAAVRYHAWHHEDGDTHSVSYRADEDEHGVWLGLPSCGNGIRKGKAPSVFPSRSHNADGSLRWQPSIHMPRWASRLTLIVTDVRVERLQDITEADAIAEGAKQYSSSTKLSRAFNPDWKGNYREGYAELWNEINGAGAWESNPWIVAYTFTVHRQNIDAMSKEAA